jgi:hypothetical protein
MAENSFQRCSVLAIHQHNDSTISYHVKGPPCLINTVIGEAQKRKRIAPGGWWPSQIGALKQESSLSPEPAKKPDFTLGR